jgi:hypothetical protein
MHLEDSPTPVDTLVKGPNMCNNTRIFKITGPLCIKINFNTEKFETYRLHSPSQWNWSISKALEYNNSELWLNKIKYYSYFHTYW